MIAADRPRRASEQRVLVVATDAELRTTIAEALTESGYVVRVAAEGSTGVVLARSWQPRFVAMTLVAQRLDRWTIQRLTTQGRGGTRIPVIVVASGDEETDREVSEAEFCHLVRPPLRAQQFVEAIERLTGGWDPRSAGDAE